MFNYVLVGLNHRTARVDFRQLASFSAIKLPQGLKTLSERPGILECMIISTCNRVEILSSTNNPPEGINAMESFLSEFSSISLPDLQPKLYSYSGDQTVRHVFRLASSLDSMILGEPQILGQLKSSYSMAVDSRTIGTYLNSLLQAAFRAAKRVRSETSIGEYSVSVSSAAVELIQKIFGHLQKRSILIVGTGKIGETAVRHLAELGAGAIYLANRSPEAAAELAGRFNGIAVPFAELQEWILRSDIVITSTGASEILIDRPTVRHIMQQRKNAPMAFIDISVPRNVDPAVGTIDNVFSYDIDDLGSVVEANFHERVKAASAAEKIVEQEVRYFCTRLKSLDAGPAVKQVQKRIEEICQNELERCLRKIGPQDPKQVKELERMIARIAGKIAHPLIMQLRTGQDSPYNSACADLIRRILNSEDTEQL
jgi:glutamyl-tRNA reductase